MTSKKIDLKLKTSIIAVILLITLISVYSYVLLYNKSSSYPTVNKGRLLTYNMKTTIEEALSKGSLYNQINSPYPLAVIDTYGKVLFSSIPNYKKDTTVNLNDVVEYDNKSSIEQPDFVKYSTPLLKNHTQVGTAVFLIPKEDFLSRSPELSSLLLILPIIFASLLIVGIALYSYRFLKRDILAPITTLHESARRILKGDFSYQVQFDDDTEIGTFCHDFEAMRDELKYSKEKELAIKANEKELLACLSHDIKTPLTAIHGYVSGIKDGIVKDKEGIDHYCTITLNRVRMLTKLLDDILEHSSAELNKMEIVLTEFYCRDFFIDLLEDLSVEVKSKGLQFTYPDDTPNLLIHGDKKRLSQVLYNLVSNSIKYSREQGTISVYFKHDMNYLYVYVKDTGMGISSIEIPNIFNKFYRGEKSRNQNIPGSGLGLSISKYIMEAHGGFIQCVESSSEGTIMSIGLPI